MRASAWSTQQLAEFLAAVSASQTEVSAALTAVERAAEALDAEVAAIVRGDELVAAVGYPRGEAPVADLAAVVPGAAGCELAVPGVGICAASAVSLEHPPGATLVLARYGPDALTPEEAAVLRGMARVTSLTMRMLRLLDDERAAREESDRQAAENARLLTALTERQALLQQLAREQTALRRVATLVARGTAPAEVFAAVAQEVGLLLQADIAHMVRYETDDTVSVVAAWGSDGDLPVGQRWTLEGRSISGLVLETCKTARLDGYTDAPAAIQAFARGLGVRSSVGAPVLVEGRLWGALVASSVKPERLPPDTESRIADFAELVATAIANAESRTELKASRVRIVAASDEARRRIERDLHDGVQQRLVTLALQVGTLREAVSSERPELLAQLSHLEEGLKTLLDEVREISRGVHPAILSEGGLGPALKSLARRCPLPVELGMGPVGRLPKPVEVAAYYVVSEALANVAKHANASVADVEVETCDGALQLSIRDDGVGGADPRRGSGILGLTDRVEALGGTIAMRSPAGEGTSIVVQLPTELP